MQSEQQQGSQVLIDMRTHLTVAALAVAHLHRRQGDAAEIERLCSYAERAIMQLKEDIATMETMLSHNEGRHEPSQTHLRPLPTVSADAQGQETGPMTLPSPARSVDMHRQETRAIPLPLDNPHDRPS